MKKYLSYAVVFMILLFTIISCSSRPRHSPSPMVMEADNLFRVGKKFSSLEHYDNALRSYRLALERYSLVDYQEGIILSKIAIIGALAQTDELAIAHKKTEDLAFLIEKTAPEYLPNLLLLRTELAYLAENYENIRSLTEDFRCRDKVIESQVLSYRLLANLHLNIPERATYRLLRKNSNRLQKAYRKRKLNEVGIYSYVNHILGYYNINQERWDSAIRYLSISLEADRSIDDAAGIAQNLYYIGIAYRNLEEYEQAKIHFERAKTIFTSLNDQYRAEMADKAMRQKTND